MTSGSVLPRRRTAFRTLTVSKVDRLCADAVAITFEVPDELVEEFAHRPGQYLTLRRTVGDVEERRSYSICSAQGRPPRIGVRLVEGGLFSSWLVNDLTAGDRVDVLAPLGDFTPPPGPAHHCLIAAGSGITPVMSILSTVLADPEARATLIYGNRRTDTVMFAEELADLKDRHPDRFQLVHVLSREPRDIELFSGRLDADRLSALLERIIPAAEIDHWWLCGPYGLVQAAEGVLSAREVPRGSVHHELFYVDAPPPEPVRAEDHVHLDGPASTVTVILDGRATELTLPRDTPVLDAAQRVRADLPFACKGGVCGTCRAKVLDGEVRMRRNYALEPHELEAGFVLTCQSLPVTDHVTIDFDS